MADLSECQVGVGCLQCLRTVKPPTIGVLILPTLEGWKTEAIAFSSNISSTYLADCKLITFPIALYKVMRHVAEGIHLITLANNELKSVTSKFIITFSQLRELNLEGNYIHHLPEEVRTLLHLRNINLSRNKFHIFPDQLTSLQALEMINLEENEITGKKICSCAFKYLFVQTKYWIDFCPQMFKIYSFFLCRQILFDFSFNHTHSKTYTKVMVFTHI
uniref:Leucine rich repeat containing 20 n=1 Tax=Laticauda laticaudata TaxID=8630 RepID=A0A8C5RGT5_LATLA